jgi:lipoyl(octanoyl) transferase
VCTGRQDPGISGPAMKSTYFGLNTFEKSMGLMDQAYQLVSATGFPVLMGFEYYPVITLGKRAEASEELINSADSIQKLGIELVETDRGGQATLHSPGQLVIYPLVPIRKLGISVRDFVGILESSTILWLQKYQIKAEKREDAGVFTDRGKIAFIGIRVDRGITKHGISINISNDLSMFDQIRACGQIKRSLDSLSERGHPIELSQAFDEWGLYFGSELLKLLPGGS